MDNLNISDRNKLFWTKNDIESIHKVLGQNDIPVIDMGKALSEFLRNRKIDKYISIDVEEFIKASIREQSFSANNGIKTIIIKNLGILLEPELQVKPETILLDLSRDIVVILLWDYFVEHNRKLVWDENIPKYFEFPENTIKHLELII